MAPLRARVGGGRGGGGASPSGRGSMSARTVAAAAAAAAASGSAGAPEEPGPARVGTRGRGGVTGPSPRLCLGGVGGERHWELTPVEGVLYDYLLSNTREEAVLADLRSRTAELRGARMQVSPETGSFLQMLAGLLSAERALEVGVFTGYSALSLALALPDHGTLVACDRDAASMAVAQEFWAHAGVEGKVKPRLGPARETLEALLAAGEAGTYDLAFVDADKRSYRDYYELCLRLVRPGGAVVLDNLLFYGRVIDPGRDRATEALRDFTAFAARDPRVAWSLLPVGDGLGVCRKL